ncbi:MAG: tRNA 2-thiouridine(34) synthase MnmA, partial [Propionibacteriaceae bacterium]|nr:tRNA 2-thiouridine(34) synthase MnmA [Propionibacteriaceae bacterium]
FAYTVGQRRGLRLGRPAADGRPRDVTRVEPAAATVVVGPRASLSVDRLDTVRPVWCAAPPPDEFAAAVQFRAHGQPVPAVARVDGERVVVDLAAPAAGVAAGQTAVLYDGDRVVGSAVIAAASRIATKL